MRHREIFPLQARRGQFLLTAWTNWSTNASYSSPTTRRCCHPRYSGSLEILRVVRPDVQHDRERPRRMDAADRGVQRQLPDRDPEPVDPLVADAENPLAVGHDDHVDVGMGTVPQQFGDLVPQRIRHDEAAGPAVDVAELLTRLADDRGVDDRRHLFDVLQTSAGRTAPRWCPAARAGRCGARDRRLALVRVVGARHLLRERLDARRQQPVQPQRRPLLGGECGPLVERRGVEQLHPPQVGPWIGVLHRVPARCHRHPPHSLSLSPSPVRPRIIRGSTPEAWRSLCKIVM